MAEGKVLWFNNLKGFGFIRPEIKGPDIFVHISALKKSHIATLAEGTVVRYNLAEGRNNRVCASDIEVVTKP